MSSGITLAAIDAGSNAVRAVVAEVREDGTFVPIATERVPVRLGSGAFTLGAIEAPTIDAAVTAFARFKKLFDSHGVKTYRAVATSAVRNASNREDLLDRCFRELELDIEVIDGEEEARLVRNAVTHRLGEARLPPLIVDLGGGSLEVLSRTLDGWDPFSMKVGTVRMLETFGLKGAFSGDEARMIRRFVRSTIRSALPDDMFEQGAPEAAACGGNAEALAELFGTKDEHGVSVLEVSALSKNLSSITHVDVKQRMTDFGVRKDRAEVMGVAALVFTCLAKELGIERYVVPHVGIREGVLLDLAQEQAGQIGKSGEPASIAAARAFADRIGHNITHGEQVRQVAAKLYTQLQPLHELGSECHRVLQIAALLHDIGEVVHRKSHHKHSEYLIRQGRIPGLTQTQRDMAAAVARAHRKSSPTERKHNTYAALNPESQEAVRRMAAMLRIADSLDTDHRQRIVDVKADITKKKVVFQVSMEQGSSLVEDSLTHKAALFEETFDRRVEFSISEVSARRRRRTRSA